MSRTEVVLAAPAGFCAGVEAAVKSLAWLTALNPPPVACVHAVVHNEEVVARFEALGVQFVDRPEDAPAGAAVLLSAHGSAPGVAARIPSPHVVVDAACPLVTKVHREMRVRSRAGDAIVYVGRRGHDEADGAVAHSESPVHVVEHAGDLDAVPIAPDQPVSILAQTTIPVSDWQQVARRAQERFTTTWTAPREDICFATSNRQAAVRALAAVCDAVVVVGSSTSSNTAALVDAAREAGGRDVRRVDEGEGLADLRGRRVGVTAGASTPQRNVDAAVRALAPSRVSTLRVADEDEHFPLAAGVRRQVEAALGARLLPPELVDAYRNDRTVSADDLLTLIERTVVGARRPPALVP